VTASTQIVQKLWNYCNLLRDDGLSYGDYVEQLTYLLFLKMAHEQTQAPWNRPSIIPSGFDWPSLLSRDGDELEAHYRHTLEELGKQKGMLGLIFRKAQNKVQDPAKLRRLIAELIDREQWTSLEADVKGDAYEELLEKNAQDVKTGAGQYFTPRALIRGIVEVVRPGPGETICDTACGTGGFLLMAHDYIARHYPNLDRVISTSSSRVIAPRTATSARRRGPRRIPAGAGEPTVTKAWFSVTSAVSISSGSGTKASRTRTISPIRMRSPSRSWRICAPRSSSSPRSRRISPRGHPSHRRTSENVR
jgi:N-6 DNA Methylase/HsdM N-terminal domain